MPTPVILANGLQPPPIGAEGNGSFAKGASVPLSLQSTTGVQSILWTLVRKPTGSACAIDTTTSLTPNLAPLDSVGTYAFTAKVTYASGVVTVQAAVTVRTRTRALRLPATSEALAYDPNAGTVAWDGSDGWGTAARSLGTAIENATDVSVLDFGADPTGASDSYTAFTNAVAALAPGGTLWIPAGVFLLSAAVIIGTANLHIEGRGPSSVIRSTSLTHDHCFRFRADGISITKVYLQGNATDSTTSQWGVFSEQAHPAKHCRVTECWFGGPDGTHGINSGVKIDTGNDYWEVSKNRFQQLVGNDSGVGAGYGILNGGTKGALIDGNWIFGASIGGRHAVYLTGPCSGSLVRGNRAYNMLATSFPLSSTPSEGASTNNRLEGNYSEGQGADTSSTSGAINLDGAMSGNIVIGNTIVDCGRNGIVVNNAAQTDGSSTGNEIKNNTIRRAASVGIEAFGSKHLLIEGNTVEDASHGNPGDVPAISITKDPTIAVQSDYVRVIGNAITASNPSSPKHRLGVLLDPSPGNQPTHCEVSRNSIVIGLGAAQLGFINFDATVKAIVRDNLADLEQVYTASDTAPTVVGTKLFAVSNGGAVSITEFRDGIDQQELEVAFDGNTTVVHNTSHIVLANHINVTPTANSRMRFRCVGNQSTGAVWYETSRTIV